jgi:hypothetical protein
MIQMYVCKYIQVLVLRFPSLLAQLILLSILGTGWWVLSSAKLTHGSLELSSLLLIAQHTLVWTFYLHDTLPLNALYTMVTCKTPPLSLLSLSYLLLWQPRSLASQDVKWIVTSSAFLLCLIAATNDFPSFVTPHSDLESQNKVLQPLVFLSLYYHVPLSLF